MSKSNVEMSLDDIIKANKSKVKGAGKKSPKGNLSSNGILKRGKKLVKQTQNSRAQKVKSNGLRMAGKGMMVKQTTQSASVATKKLVQKLVKKALAQSNVRIAPVRQSIIPRKILQRPSFRGGRVIKKTVVVNRLKLNPRSRAIVRRPRMVTQKVVNVRRPRMVTQKVVSARRPRVVAQKVFNTGGRDLMRFNPNAVVNTLTRRANFVPNFVRRQAMVQAVPDRVIQQRVQPVYQATFVQNRSSIRDHISRLKTSGGVNLIQAPIQTQVVRRQQRPVQQRRQNFQQQQVTYVPQQRPQQQRRNNIRGQQLLRVNDPFFEPPNFLQRVPGVQNAGGRRY